MKPFTTEQLGQFFDDFKGADLAVTENGIRIDNKELSFNDILPAGMLPEWEQAKKSLSHLSPTALTRAFQICLFSALAGISDAHKHDPTKGTKICFKDVHNTGVGVVHVEDTSGALSTLVNSMKSAVTSCGTSLLSSCSKTITSNATIIFDWLYHKNAWSQAACDTQATMIDVAHFAKTTMFDDSHIHCIQDKGIEALQQISMAVNKNLTAAHQNDACHQVPAEDCGTFGTVAATTAVIVAAAGIIGCCLHYQKKNGHLPCSNLKLPTGGFLGGNKGYEDLGKAENGDSSSHQANPRF